MFITSALSLQTCVVQQTRILIALKRSEMPFVLLFSLIKFVDLLLFLFLVSSLSLSSSQHFFSYFGFSFVCFVRTQAHVNSYTERKESGNCDDNNIILSNVHIHINHKKKRDQFQPFRNSLAQHHVGNMNTSTTFV